MILKINRVKDFGVFKNFNGSALPEFKTFNLIYGWNYSGKTTLSRIFQCLEKGELHQDYQSASFEFQGDASTTYDSSFSLKPNIRVFNSDFIKENLKWDSDNYEPIFLLGAENIELQKELKTKSDEFTQEEESINVAKKTREDKKNNINNQLTIKARDITTLLGLGRSFDRDKLKQILDEIKTQTTSFKLSGIDFQKYKAQAISNEQKPIIEKISFRTPEIVPITLKTREVLHRQPLNSNKLQRLLDDKALSDWVEIGKELHKEKSTCQFCGNPIPDDLLSKLNDHFSRDYEKLKSDIESQIDLFESLKISISLPAETAFYTDLQSEFREKKPLIESEFSAFNSFISTLHQKLIAKKDKPFDKLELTASDYDVAALVKAFASLNELIEKNNKRTQDFLSEKNSAIQKLKIHYAAEFEINNHYFSILKELDTEQGDIDERESKNKALSKKITLIKSQLDETIKGAIKVNDYLQIFFGKDDIKIQSTPDKKFKLTRGDALAKNLSEGEKTAIAFAYFTAKLEEQNNNISETIVYIDDPVSSLDSNHLFNIYSFIKATFYEFVFDKAQNKNIHKAKCKQLFISTHNFDFHNLIYDWFKKTKDEKYQLFMVERQKNSFKDESTIKINSELIAQFNSEYAYLFSMIQNFQQTPTETNENLYHLPNIARRFVETYLNFKYMSRHNLDEKIDQLIKKNVDCERARKFMHYYSHSLSTDRVVKYPDLSECKAVIDIILNAIQADDPTHFSSLEDAIK